MLTIDLQKCRQDGLCAKDCPAGIIRFDGKDSYPELIPAMEAVCLRCGHCVAACPHGALDHADVPLSQSPVIDRSLSISKEQTVQLLRSRRSIRRFKQRPVDKVLIQELIEIARYAPTGSNMQLVEWVVINDRAQLRALSAGAVDWMRDVLKADPKARSMPYLPRFIDAWDAGMDTVLWNAPCLIIAMAPAHDRSGMVNLSLALSYLELVATTRGLGTCWAGLLNMVVGSVPRLKSMAGIPEDYPHHYPMMLGYPKVKYYRLPERRPPKIVWK